MPAAEPAAADLPGDVFSALDLATRPKIALAVSGGGDSMALLHLLRLHVETGRILALTVDHGLRAGSAGEAAEVARHCASLGIEHRILTWNGPRPASGLAAAAREARYRLLSDAAEEAGCGLALLGHTLDDQLETIAMRQARGEGRGLAGIAPATLHDWRVWFARPLLGTGRQALRDFLIGRGVRWIEDPTNVDPAFERARVRQGGLSGAERARLLEVADRAGRERRRLARAAAALLDAHAERPAPGLLRVDPALFAADDGDAATLALRAALAVAGANEFLPDPEAAARLCARIETGEGFRATLSGALVDRRKAGLFILREAVRGTREAGGDDRPAPPGVPASLARAARFRPGPDGLPPAPWARFLPSFDLPLANVFARLYDAPGHPASPFPRHIEAEA